MQYIVTFEERLLVEGDTRWIESSRILTKRQEAKNFLEFMYDAKSGNIRNVQIWQADRIHYGVRSVVWFES